MKYVIGTRGSRLALAQAEYVLRRLAEAYPKDEFVLRKVKTKGDLILDKPLHEIGDKGLFVKEIEEQLLNHTIDIGVHSMKDMPALPAAGLIFSKAWKREDPRDVLILRKEGSLEALPQGAVIGTGSRRREFQLKRLRPDLKVVNIRGNVDTRLRKMEEQQLDGIVLAAAGLHRLGMQDKVTVYLEPEEMIPAPAQGILALELREQDQELLHKLDALSHEETAGAAAAERGFLQEIGGDCHVPIGAVCTKEGDGRYTLLAMFGNDTGSRQAYAEVSGTDPGELAKEAARQIRRQLAGTVTLVGAGPGDRELITLRGLRAIREADCIVYDRLAAPALLEEARPGCELIYVGKASSQHTMKQEEINRLLVAMSMKHGSTVRLKGGDVYVFGRGGEEGLFLREQGVPFEVVPGVSSAVAGLAYAGIPITHRGIAHGFRVVTAHDKDDQLTDLDFPSMARGKETCVFLMGLSKVGEIAGRLLEAGMPPETKAAVISCATTPNQRTCVAELSRLAAAVEEAGLVSPAAIVVGNVVALREKLDFFEGRPLFGRKYLIPVIGEKRTRLCELLQEQGAAVHEVQVGNIVNLQRQFQAEEIQGVDWMVFTSKNGVEAFFESLFGSGLDVRSLGGVKVAVIGDKTAEALGRYGIRPDLIPGEFHSGALISALQNTLKGQETVWYVKAANADHSLQEALGELCTLEEVVVYENQGVAFELEEAGSLAGYDGILVTCASSAKRLFAKCRGEWEQLEQPLPVYSIGPKTTACLKKIGIERVVEARQADYDSLCGLLVRDKNKNFCGSL